MYKRKDKTKIIPMETSQPPTVTGTSDDGVTVTIRRDDFCTPVILSSFLAYTIVKAENGLCQMAELKIVEGKLMEVNYSVSDIKALIISRIQNKLEILAPQEKP